MKNNFLTSSIIACFELILLSSCVCVISVIIGWIIGSPINWMTLVSGMSCVAVSFIATILVIIGRITGSGAEE